LAEANRCYFAEDHVSGAWRRQMLGALVTELQGVYAGEKVFSGAEGNGRDVWFTLQSASHGDRPTAGPQQSVSNLKPARSPGKVTECTTC
jgi:hypothetical protein